MKFPQDLPFGAAMTLAIKKKVARQIELYRLEVLQGENKQCKLTVQLGEQKPHFTKTFPDINTCADYLNVKGLGTQGWVPTEIAERNRHIDIQTKWRDSAADED